VSEYEIIIDGPPPPRPGRSHWTVISRAKKQWTEYIGWIALSKKIPKQAVTGLREVTITFHRPGPVSDTDNAHALCKVPLDAMVRVGLLRDDSPHCMTLKVDTISSRKSFTRITLADK
jgi:Holliday junction resolvase RusA-like endonuclease